jgi:hypothetical protein
MAKPVLTLLVHEQRLMRFSDGVAFGPSASLGESARCVGALELMGTSAALARRRDEDPPSWGGSPSLVVLACVTPLEDNAQFRVT